MGKEKGSKDGSFKKEKKPKRIRPEKPTQATPIVKPTPFVKQPVHAKWPSLFKRHLGLIESQIRVYDRLMQSMRAEMNSMPDEQRGRWERGEEGHWQTLCGMMSRGRQLLIDARIAGTGILPPELLKEKKSLGPMFQESAAFQAFQPLGASSTNEKKNARQASITDEDGDTSMADAETDAEDGPLPQFTPLNLPLKRKLAQGTAEDTDRAGGEAFGFVIDPNPTPVPEPKVKKAKKSKKAKDEDAALEEDSKRAFDDIAEPATKKVKRFKISKDKEAALNNGTKRSVDDEDEAVEKVTKKLNKSKVDGEHVLVDPPAQHREIPGGSKVDFIALEKQLQAEVEAGKIREQERKAEQASSSEDAETSKKEKKRKRISTGSTSEAVEKRKIKKGKQEKKT
ncbi:hypothetical protein B0O99DRAFT_611341 [Bisporella sp. PMI_857]|nr:hypothetical protein B0O99DRAFT_611341 [Bisporella sp. PMI_857]